MLALRWSAGPDVVVQSPASDLTLRAVDARGADRALAPVHPAPWLAVLALAVLAPSSVSWAEASSPPLVLEVALVDDPELPPLDDTLVARALAAASDTFAQRFAVTAPRFTVVARFGLESFMKRYAKASSPECSALLAARYKGGGRAELLTRQSSDSLVSGVDRAMVLTNAIQRPPSWSALPMPCSRAGTARARMPSPTTSIG